MPVEQMAARPVPAALWSRPGSDGRVVETADAVLCLTADRVLKRRRPLDPGEPAFRGLLTRLAACRAEVARNRPLAPDVYLGVADVVDDGGVVQDHAVVLRRLPAGRQLASLLRRGGHIDEEVRAVARAVAGFHARCETSHGSGVDDPGRSEARWQEAITAASAFRGTVLEAELVDEIGRLARAYLAGRGAMLAGRVTGGWVRDGHGSLRADDIYCLDDGPRILARAEADGRHDDVLGDVALLAVELERLGSSEDADLLLRAYQEFAGTAHPRSLEHLHIAYRALVEAATVAAAAGEQARRLADIAYRHLRRARVRLVLVGGLPGTGKTTLAGRLAAGDGGRVLIRSDEVRARFSAEEVGTDNSYVWPLASEITARTYTELLARARVFLSGGETVIIDASWSDGRHRAAAARLARETGAELIELRCVTSPEVAAARLARRDAARQAASGPAGASELSGASGAVGSGRPTTTAGAMSTLHRAMSAWAEPWPTARVIQTTVPEGEAFQAAERCVA
ncbi:hypothetical protein Ga0074812_106199 [Parafrankia irregularis]|uniref:AAA domain-containing protein n=1 Tax=Parafrankia irregularis TaxID=795642 RepID=A0A0S4QM37_9ACTN|nr:MULTISPECIES: AAA family ATPase [Parafrankia]MBE3202159.1 AAA family ATPase [Parafrankia sp. CH37]CUU55944.1 hypothetical protein Ga0074812_106199 [Parafrankia irregularis]